YQGVGQRDSALYWHRRAAAAWETWRSGTTTDPAWRERFDNAALQFSNRYALALLEGPGTGPSRAAAAFDALQPHRARTLAERMQDPARGRSTGPGIISATRLQSAL